MLMRNFYLFRDLSKNHRAVNRPRKDAKGKFARKRATSRCISRSFWKASICINKRNRRRLLKQIRQPHRRRRRLHQVETESRSSTSCRIPPHRRTTILHTKWLCGMFLTTFLNHPSSQWQTFYLEERFH